MTPVVIFCIGLLAQGFFSARVLVQWLMSERAKKVQSPAIYWVLSLIGAILLCTYGWLRNDIAIIFGQLITYYIYLWNIHKNGLMHRAWLLLWSLIALLPVLFLAWLFRDVDNFADTFLKRDGLPLALVIFGMMGQLCFSLRFVYQWAYSYRRGISVLPTGFWVISLVGSSMIIAYGIFRLDAILILGQALGFVTSLRNLIIGRKQVSKQ